jgi:hypothetical protein
MTTQLARRILALSILLAGCGLVPTDLAAAPTATPVPDPHDDLAPPPGSPPTYVESNLPDSFEACPGEGLNLLASYEIEPEGISHVVIRYRLNGSAPEKTSPWQEYVMAPEGILDALDHFRFQYANLGMEANDLFGGDPGIFEFQLLAVDNDSLASKWPAGEGIMAEMPIEPCADEQMSYQLHNYGVSSTSAGYGPECSPTELTFEVIVSGFELVDSAWLRYEYHAPANSPAIVSPSFEVPLQVTGEGPGYPGSTRLAATVNVGGEADNFMQTQDGFLSYNMYVRLADQQVFEYPNGGPPMVTIDSCLEATATPLSLIPILPTPTSIQLKLSVLPTATPVRR